MNHHLWPKNWPKYRNNNRLCDRLVGTCICGQYHNPGEFEYVDGILYRNKKVVPGDLIVPVGQVIVGQAARQEGKTIVIKLEKLRQQRRDIDREIKKLDRRIKINALFGPTMRVLRVSIHRESGEPTILEFNKRLEVLKLKETITEILEGLNE